MHRRSVLATIPAIAVALAGCASTNSTATISNEAVTDLNLIATALEPLGDTVATMAGATPAIVAQVNTDVAQLAAAAQAVAPGISTAVAQPSVMTVASALQAIVNALQGFALPANVQSVLTAAEALLPLVQMAVGIAIAVAAPKAGAMTPAQARVVLAAAAS